jgi:hypothetical protein
MSNTRRIAALRGRNFGILACAVRDYLNAVEHIMTRFEDTENARRVQAIVTSAVARGQFKQLQSKIDVVVENVYQKLPSGDYGRGDVRRVIEKTLAAWELS